MLPIGYNDHDKVFAIFSTCLKRSGIEPKSSVVLCLMASCRHESGYGSLWGSRSIFDKLVNYGWLDKKVDYLQFKEAHETGYNLGAIQVPPTPYSRFRTRGPYPVCTNDGTLYIDTSPKSDGTSSPYPIYFKRYSSFEESSLGVIKVTYLNRPSVLKAADEGDVLAFSTTMRNTNYYEGFGKTRDDRIRNHYAAIMHHLNVICRSLKMPLPNGEPALPETVRKGDRSETVKDLQRILLALKYDIGPVDGWFGRATFDAVQTEQRKAGLEVDGLVGPMTWRHLLDRSTDFPEEPTTSVETPEAKEILDTPSKSEYESLLARVEILENAREDHRKRIDTLEMFMENA